MAAEQLHYFICPKCQRAVPAATQEYYCSNDGNKLLRACPHCQVGITSPYSRFCASCGKKLIVHPSTLSENPEG